MNKRIAKKWLTRAANGPFPYKHFWIAYVIVEKHPKARRICKMRAKWDTKVIQGLSSSRFSTVPPRPVKWDYKKWLITRRYFNHRLNRKLIDLRPRRDQFLALVDIMGERKAYMVLSQYRKKSCQLLVEGITAERLREKGVLI